MLSKKNKETVAELEEFGSLTKIYPAQAEGQQEESAVNVNELVLNLRQIFYALTPIKNKAQISSQMFEKLHQKPVVKSCGIQKIDMSLAFSQSAGGVNGTRYLNFLGFCHLMLSFYEKKMVK